jgi:hypothetical protein
MLPGGGSDISVQREGSRSHVGREPFALAPQSGFPSADNSKCGAPRDPDLGLSALWRVLPIRDADGPHDVRRDPAREHAGTLLRLRPRRQVPQRRLRLHVRPNIAVGSCLRAGFACDREGRLSRAPRVACLARPLLRGSRPFAASASASQLCGFTADRVSPSPGLARSQRQPRGHRLPRRLRALRPTYRRSPA